MRNYSTRIIIPNHPTRSRLRVAVYILCIVISLLPKHVYAEQTAPIVVRYPASDSNPHYYKRVKYFVEILELALSKSNHQYQLQKISLPFMNESRSKTNLTANLYDIHWLNTQTFLDQDLQPIRIPLCKGLTGWRVFFIRPESQQQFSDIKSTNDLKRYTAGNGNDWPEAILYDQVGLPQKLSGSWKGLFYMLKQNRIDYLSRSALEIYDEEDAFPELNLKVESKLIIQYPAAYYFYVSKNNEQLAADIEIGLERAIADGSFDKIFNRYFSEKLKRLDFGQRRIVKVTASENTTLLSDQKKHPSYWYNN